MAASIAEAYMLILRPVPILGEAWAIPFNGQIMLDEWKWGLTPATAQRPQAPAPAPAEGQSGPQERTGGPAAATRPELARPPPPFDGDGLIEAVRRMQTNRGLRTQEERDRRVRQLIERAADEHQRAQTQATRQQGGGAGAGADADAAADSTEGKLTFTFSKNVDLATSQMLYSLANNDLIPTVIMTLFHRSSTSPVTLVITMINVRFESCNISCDGQDTMAEMKEDWQANYEHISYVYQNRPPTGIPASPFVMATQGRVKVFVMNPRGGGLPS